MHRQVRFYYDGSWTRWFGDDDDLSFLRDLAIDKMEVVETLPREQALEFIRNLEAAPRAE